LGIIGGRLGSPLSVFNSGSVVMIFQCLFCGPGKPRVLNIRSPSQRFVSRRSLIGSIASILRRTITDLVRLRFDQTGKRDDLQTDDLQAHQRGLQASQLGGQSVTIEEVGSKALRF